MTTPPASPHEAVLFQLHKRKAAKNMASGSAPTRYQLSSTLAGHNADVRALVGCPRAHLAASSSSSSATTDNSSGSGASYDAQRPVLFSTSRDGTARGWVCRGGQQAQLEGGGAGGGGWVEGPVFGGVGSAGHEGFVNAVEWMHPAPEAPGGEFPVLFLAVGRLHSSGAAGGRVKPLARSACAGRTRPPLNSTDTDASLPGYLLTGGQDKLIHAWPLPDPSTLSNADSPASALPSPTPSHTLIGHEGNVCALHVSNDGKRIVSGSWDKCVSFFLLFHISASSGRCKASELGGRILREYAKE